jgi:aryl-alcohol dehydrogenase-like predicted oxidoreductase
MGESCMPKKVPVETLARLALGTAQFGLQYGLANSSGRVMPADIETILLNARRAGMDTLDTAVAYGESESALGSAGVTSWRVITKLPPLPGDVDDIAGWVAAHVRDSLRRLGVAQLEALLLHKPSDLLGSGGRRYAEALGELKARGYVRALGLSIYDPAELDAVWPAWQPEIVQAPCNVLDRRLIRSGWLAKLRSSGVRTHVRSAFLQGLLLMPAARRPACFTRWAGLLDRWLDWCLTQEISPLGAALAFVQAQPDVERIVVGVESPAQLEQIVAVAARSAPMPPDDLWSEDRNLLEPSRWDLT